MKQIKRKSLLELVQDRVNKTTDTSTYKEVEVPETQNSLIWDKVKQNAENIQKNNNVSTWDRVQARAKKSIFGDIRNVDVNSNAFVNNRLNVDTAISAIGKVANIKNTNEEIKPRINRINSSLFNKMNQARKTEDNTEEKTQVMLPTSKNLKENSLPTKVEKPLLYKQKGVSISNEEANRISKLDSKTRFKEIAKYSNNEEQRKANTYLVNQYLINNNAKEEAEKDNNIAKNGNLLQKAGVYIKVAGKELGTGIINHVGDVVSMFYNLPTKLANLAGTESVQQKCHYLHPNNGIISPEDFTNTYKQLKGGTEEYISNLEGSLKTTGKVANTIGNMVPAMVMGQALGTSPETANVISKFTSALYSGASTYNDTLNEEQTNVLKSFLKGSLYGIATYEIEGITGGNIISKTGSLDDLAVGQIKQIKSIAEKKIFSILYDIGGEIGEENLENWVDHLIDFAFGDAKDISIKGLVEEFKETTKSTAMTNVVLQLLGLGGGTYNDVQQSQVTDIINNDNNLSTNQKETLIEMMDNNEINYNEAMYLAEKNKSNLTTEQLDNAESFFEKNNISQDKRDELLNKVDKKIKETNNQIEKIIKESNLDENIQQNLLNVSKRHNLSVENIKSLIRNTIDGKYDKNQQTTMQNNQLLNDNQQITQEQNKTSQKEISEQIRKDSENFAKQVDIAQKGMFPQRNMLTLLSKTPEALKDIGLPDLPITMTQKHLKTIMNESGKYKNANYHNLGKDIIKQLPEAIANPLDIVQSKTKEDSIVLTTYLADKQDRTVIASIKIDGKGQINDIEIDTNVMTSAYGKDNYESFMDKNLKEGNLLYDIDRGVIKKPLWLGSNYLDTETSSVDTVDDVSTTNNSISRNAENMQVQQQKNIELTEENTKKLQNKIESEKYKSDENAKEFFKSAIENNIDISNEKVDGLYDLATARGIKVKVDTEIFKDHNGNVNKNINAVYTSDKDGNRSIIYNPETNIETIIEKNAIHETFHDMVGTKEGQEVIDFVYNKIKDSTDFFEAYDNLRETYAKAKDSDGNLLYDIKSEKFEEMIKEEAVADYLGTNLGTQEYINELVNGKESRNIAQKIYDAIVKFLDKVTGYKSEEAYLRGLKEKFEKAFNAEYNNKGANNKYSFAGINSKTANYSTLTQAENLERQGKKAQEIFEQTGWYRGNENKWRYEIDDSNFTISNNIRPNTGYNLKNILQNADELYKAYPQLKDAEVNFAELPANIAGGYSETFDSYIINNSMINDIAELKKTLIHEIQHNIQAIEDFSRGNSDNWQEIKTKLENKMTDIDKQIDNINGKIGFEDYKNKLFNEYLENNNFNSDEYFSKLEEFQNNSKYGEQIQRLRMQKKSVEATYGNIKNRTNEELYENTAGEQESRNVEKRLDMSSKERKIVLPFVKDEKTVYNIENRLPYEFNGNKYEMILRRDITNGKSRIGNNSGYKGFNIPRTYTDSNSSGRTTRREREYTYKQTEGSKGQSRWIDKGESISDIRRASNKSRELENNSSSSFLQEKNIKLSQNLIGKWEEFLEKHKINEGTRTTLGEIKLPHKEEIKMPQKVEKVKNKAYNSNESESGNNGEIQKFQRLSGQFDTRLQQENKFKEKTKYTRAEYEKFEKTITSTEESKLTREQKQLKKDMKRQYNKDVVFFSAQNNDGYIGGASLIDSNKIYIDVDSVENFGLNRIALHETLESNLRHNKELKDEFINPTIESIIKDSNFQKQKEIFWEGQEGEMPNDYAIAKDILCDTFAVIKSGEELDYKNVLSNETNMNIKYSLENFENQLRNKKISINEDNSKIELPQNPNRINTVNKEIDKDLQAIREASKKGLGDTLSIDEQIEAITNLDTKELENKLPDTSISIVNKLTREKTTFKDFTREIRKLVTNKGAGADDLFKATGNKQGKWKYDRYLGSFSEGQVSIGINQVDSQGNIVGDSLISIYDNAKKNGITQKILDNYVLNKDNIARSKYEKYLFGEEITAKESQKLIDEYDKKYPEIKEYAKKVSDYANNNTISYLKGTFISEDLYSKLREMYPDHVPIIRDITETPGMSEYDNVGTQVLKRAKGGNEEILSPKESLAQQSISYAKAYRRNEALKEVYKSIKSDTKVLYDLGEIIDIEQANDCIKNAIGYDESLKKYTATIFENGEAKVFEISKDIYDAFTENEHIQAFENTIDKLLIGKVLKTTSSTFKSLTTGKNILYALKNMVRDINDAPINSTTNFANYMKDWSYAYEQIVRKGKYYQEYINAGGSANTFYDYNKGLLKKEFKSLPKKAIDFLNNQTIGRVEAINEVVEAAPRLAEYIATRQRGGTIDEALYNAAEVTTNFKRGGELTKLIDKYGVPYLNASVQGLSKVYRNISEARGFKGYAKLAINATIAGIVPSLINHLVYEDDDEYKELPDYIKDGYYLIKIDNLPNYMKDKLEKWTENNFVRIPKGRISGVLGSTAVRIHKSLNQDGNDIWNNYISDVVLNNIGINNPLTNNLFSGIIQAKRNEAWYGGTIYSETKYSGKLAMEITDEKTDQLSNWIAQTVYNLVVSTAGKEKYIELTNKESRNDFFKVISNPKLLNYVFDQYSGIIGDLVLPALTPFAEDNALIDQFTTSSILKSTTSSKFYEILGNCCPDSEYATDTDKLTYKYLNKKSKELGDLYKRKSEIQNDSSIDNTEKKRQTYQIQEEINKQMEEAINAVENLKLNSNTASFNGSNYYKDEEGEWTTIKENEVPKSLSTETYGDYKNKRTVETKRKKARTGDENAKLNQSEEIKLIQNSTYTDEEKRIIYSNYISKNDDTYNIISKLENGKTNIDEYLEYKMQDIKSDEDMDSDIVGKKVSKGEGSAKYKTIEYINNSKMTTIEKLYIIETKYPNVLNEAQKESLYNLVQKKFTNRDELEEVLKKFKDLEKHKDDGKWYWKK